MLAASEWSPPIVTGFIDKSDVPEEVLGVLQNAIQFSEQAS